MAFGERLAQLRRDRGMTQEEFAAQLNVSRQAVSKWESCRGYPELEKILYICSRWDVTLNELFSDELPPADRAEVRPEPPERMASQPLKTALGEFVSNLSPANKWAGAGSLIGVTLLIGLCIRYLRGGGDMEMTALWIGAIIVFGVVEALTAGLVSIWFVPGAVAGLIAAMADLSILAQLVLFLMVSAAALAATRPLVRKFTAGKAVPTNADRVLGEQGKVTETIDNGNSRGAVYVDGKTWTARSADDTVIPAGTQVRIERMEGVKLLVRELSQTGSEKKEEENVQ